MTSVYGPDGFGTMTARRKKAIGRTFDRQAAPSYSAAPSGQDPVTATSRKPVALGPNAVFSAEDFVVVAGPCAVESRDGLLEVARFVAEGGAQALRGGAFKPRTSPTSFQGLGEEGLRYLAEASRETGLPVVTEVMDPRQLEAVAEVASMLQIGSRNMQNFSLLREVGQLRKPVLLKRGAAATLDELLAAADYVLHGGNEQVVLCERGIRSFDQSTRYLLDLSAVPILQQRSQLPVVVDPSHGTGRRDLVLPMARAAAAAGADGVLVEVHPRPEEALSDGPQALRFEDFSTLMTQIRAWISVTGRYLSGTEASRSESPATRPSARTEASAG